MVSTDRDKVIQCLAAINPAALDYDEWLAVGMACKDAGLPFAEWDRWSAQDAKRYRKGEMPSKWASFRGNAAKPVGIGTMVKLAADQGRRIEGARGASDAGHELAWDSVIGGDKDPMPMVRNASEVEPQELPPEPDGEWNGIADLSAYLRVVFSSEERVGIVTDAWEQDAPDGAKRWLPKRGVWDRTAGELLECLACANDLGEVIGDCPKDAGAWIRFNPLDGEGCSDANVTAFRHALVESDDISVERQRAIYEEMQLPVAALVHSGGKSLHAIVRIEAPDHREYQKRVDFLYDACKRKGLVIDRKNRNPSRLSRLPGVLRAGNKQWLVATNVGKATWAEWADWIAAQNDDLPEVENLNDVTKGLTCLPPLAPVLIEGILRCGHKLLVTGPANAGKSMGLQHLAVAIAEGRRWINWQCRQGRVLLVNLEVDPASFYHRLAAVYQALGIPPTNVGAIDVWNLRGMAQALDQLTPRLIRRAAKGNYAAIILDPIYKVLTGDENAAHEMAMFCNQFDRMCREIGSAVIYCHHHSKGAQGGKAAADRASGSGVFKRDPDALLDLTELVIDEPRRAQVVNRWECDAMAAEFDRVAPAWRDECPQDIAIVAEKLAEWSLTHLDLGEPMREARPYARMAATLATGWRLECGTVREFAKFPPVRVWFRYPLHVPDTDGLLADALAEGEEPPHKRTPKEAGEAKAQRTIDDTRNAVNACRDAAGTVTLESVVEYLGLKERSVRERLDNAGLSVRHGLVVDEK